MNKYLEKEVKTIYVMIFLAFASLFGMAYFVVSEKAKSDRRLKMLNTASGIALDKGVNKDTLKAALINSDTLK